MAGQSIDTAPKAHASTWQAHARTHPLLWALTLIVISAGVLLCVWSLISVWRHADTQILHYVLLGGTGGLLATGLGAAIALAFRSIAAKVQDVALGFAGGMMLAASTFSLLLPGLEAAREQFNNDVGAALIVIAGLGAGVALMLVLDTLVPHEHENSGRQGLHDERLHRVWLFVLAITLHNLPEGMAIGVSLSKGDLAVGVPLTTAILLQDIPEGLAVAMSLRATGLGRGKAALVALGSGLMEPLGALLGLGLSNGFAWSYPVSMGLAAGAMIFVVSHEVIPETHRNGHQTPATLGLMLGFAVMMFLDVALG